jgi:hypothetical protein
VPEAVLARYGGGTALSFAVDATALHAASRHGVPGLWPERSVRVQKPAGRIISILHEKKEAHGKKEVRRVFAFSGQVLYGVV